MTNEEAIKIFKEVREEVLAKETELSRQVFENLGIKAIDVAIKALEQESKTGHWEYVQYDNNPNIGNWHCSECRTIIPHMPVEIDRTPIYNYCPNCGAKMESEEL